jgi:hypothetical protein
VAADIPRDRIVSHAQSAGQWPRLVTWFSWFTPLSVRKATDSAAVCRQFRQSLEDPTLSVRVILPCVLVVAP